MVPRHACFDSMSIFTIVFLNAPQTLQRMPTSGQTEHKQDATPVREEESLERSNIHHDPAAPPPSNHAHESERTQPMDTDTKELPQDFFQWPNGSHSFELPLSEFNRVMQCCWATNSKQTPPRRDGSVKFHKV